MVIDIIMVRICPHEARVSRSAETLLEGSYSYAGSVPGTGAGEGPMIGILSLLLMY